MQNYCSVCGTKLEDKEYCTGCGVKVNETGRTKKKTPIYALIWSIVIAGSGQVYNGEYLKAYSIAFLMSVSSFYGFPFIIPMIIWVYNIFDAYTTALKMKKNEIPHKYSSGRDIFFYIVLLILLGLMPWLIL
ncbi:hypothetical protein [Methanohalophilus portucalensis]|uniref:Uncharacterized protein n=2 Tax=Methanohalophilus portucalensis TaxID=39664 RepID=A0A1L9C2P0_9EURY|nr:hypothetical protein [Methanohalophilus portucalensis]ATU07661.1 hypothetical protein BKM01_02020 [Methanohalophilus portucalensis]OJH48802.1 hypothetical protein MPF_1650 [Methanohalophilus portucalensis FDF-1]RNI08784.1 hypothetical protein EFE41_09765 [Methanohalophilus portucalensis FDF-1]SMH37041.1 hypothetical protein SAMN06264941_1112 [Methanohalophilus portucalensis FDF-1]